jgi:hypothetical protein
MALQEASRPVSGSQVPCLTPYCMELPWSHPMLAAGVGARTCAIF